MDSVDSRIFFHGNEALGDGLTASFLISAAFRPDSGIGGVCNIDCWLGLKGKFGMLRLGHMLAIYDDVSVPWYYTGAPGNHNPAVLWGNCGRGAGLEEGCMDNYLPKSIRYDTPEMRGFTGSVLISMRPREVAGGQREGRIVATGGEYKGELFGLGIAHQRQNDARGMGLKDDALTISAYYKGPVYIGIGLEHLRYGLPGGGSLRRNYAGIMLNYKHGAHSIWGNYGVAGSGYGDVAQARVNAIQNLPDSGARMMSIGYQYNFNRRTGIYTFYNLIDNRRNGLYTTDGNFAALLGRGENQSAFALGMRSKF
jgi:predicted porin